MANPKSKQTKRQKPEDIETEPGAEERFERTVRRMLNTPPKPHPKRERDQSVTPKGKKAKKTPAK